MTVFYDQDNNRLIYYNKSSTPEYWDEQWKTNNLNEFFHKSKNNRFILDILNKYVNNKKGKILEGGCGRGQYVYCMYSNGYDCIGVDFAPNTINLIKKSFPQLDVEVGDLRDLKFPDNYFIAYWSIGVIEHFWDGYNVILKEMHRVIAEDGYLFITFPYISPIRKIKARLGLYNLYNNNGNCDFYQYALDYGTVIKDFEQNGFKLLEMKPIDGIKGLKDEISLLKPLLQKLYDYNGNNIIIRGFRFLLNRILTKLFAHSILLVFIKNAHTMH